MLAPQQELGEGAEVGVHGGARHLFDDLLQLLAGEPRGAPLRTKCGSQPAASAACRSRSVSATIGTWRRSTP